MNRNGLLTAVLAALVAAAGPALEVESVLGLGNVAFDLSENSPLSAAEESFDPLLHGFGSLTITDRINDAFDLSAGFERDPILRNTVFTRVAFGQDYFRLTLGPVFGPFNAEGTVLNGGISAGLRLEVPGIAFVTFRTDSTIGAGLSVPGDYVQERNEVGVGFWTPNIVMTFRISSRSFTVRDTRELDIIDDCTRYELIADVYKKNVPYTATVNLGYQALSRSYVAAADTVADELRSAIVGIEFGVRATPVLGLMAGTEAALYSWGVEGLGNPDANVALFTVRLGATITLPNVGFSARQAE